MARSTLEQWRMFKAVAEHSLVEQIAELSRLALIRSPNPR